MNSTAIQHFYYNNNTYNPNTFFRTATNILLYSLPYILGIIVLLIILFFVYIRIKFRFWAIQPVFHIYDIYYWFVNVGVINKELPDKNRYTNFKNIKTISYDILNQENISDFTILVQLNYLRNNENSYIPQKDNILPYFIGHSQKSFWSFYWQPDVLLDNKTNTAVDHQKLIGVMTSRPLHVTFINKNKKNKPITMDVYYVDYLCVDKGFRKKNIAPQLIQTHEYNQSHLNRNICVSLFKREDELTGIVPLTVYKSHCFNMRNWRKPMSLSANITLLTGDKQNIYYLYNFIQETSGKWGLTVMPEMTNIIELVNTKNMFIIMLVVDGEIVAAYIFKKTCTFIEKEKEIISCIASINGNVLKQDVFIQGFKVALWSILEKPENKSFHYLLVENTSDNNCIIQNIQKKTHPLVLSPTAYFFYNFAYNTFNSNDVLIIC
jgi:hypothetical protein